MADGFAEFYSANFQRVAAQLYAYVGNHGDAQELTQEAFCRALDHWTKVSTYDHALAWVRQVAWNLATSRLRHLGVTARHLAGQRMEHVEGPGPDRVALTRALATLPPNHRLAIVLHYVGQLSTSEIAAQCGVADGTVRSWLSRGRTELAEQLVDWDEVRATPFQPDEVAVVQAKVKRRRTVRRAAVAAAVLAMLTPLVYLVVTGGRSNPPVVGPTTPPATPTPIPTRTVVVPGVTLADPPEIRFVDSRHAWLWYNSCTAPQPPSKCGHTLAATADAGTTWRTVELPAMPARSTAVMLPLDAKTLSFRFTEEGADTPTKYWLTTDGGATFTSYPLQKPPAAALIAGAGKFFFRCPGATGLEDGAWGVQCDQQELAQAGSGRVTPQPPPRSFDTTAINGADGRIWVDDGKRLYVSDDQAKTWHELPRNGSIVLSPDGRQVWAVAPDGFFELVGSAWQRRMAKVAGDEHPILVGDGLWLVRYRSAVAYLQDGTLTPIPGLPDAQYAYPLADGSLVVATDTEIYVGVGAGRQRQWSGISLR